MELSDNAVFSIGKVDCSAGKIGHSADSVVLGWIMYTFGRVSDNVVCFISKVWCSAGKVELGYYPLCNTDHRQDSALPYRPSASSDGK